MIDRKDSILHSSVGEGCFHQIAEFKMLSLEKEKTLLVIWTLSFIPENTRYMEPIFHVYIDEAGDPGVKAKVTDKPTTTDWFVLSAVVVRASRDTDVTDWVSDMIEAVRGRGTNGIHYRNLSDPNRLRVSRMLGRKPVRIFTVASQKDSMRKHQNAKLGRANDREFYNWCLRLLLERVTEWCYWKCSSENLEIAPARIIFSERGGHDYDALKIYLERLRAQTLTGNLVLKKRGIAPGIIYPDLCKVSPHAKIAGLQLADIAASAYFQAACSVSPRHNIEPAKALKARLARRFDKGAPANFGLLLLPFPHQGTIAVADRPIFTHCGYRFPVG